MGGVEVKKRGQGSSCSAAAKAAGAVELARLMQSEGRQYAKVTDSKLSIRY